MNITYLCPECENSVRVELDSSAGQLECPSCHRRSTIPDDAVQQGHVRRCLVCPSSELYVRKDFPQRLGVAIIACGFIASTIAWYYYWIYAAFAILFCTALLDAFLYLFMGNLLSCYRCHAEYRGIAGLDDHAAFDLEVHERHRQQAARLLEAQASQVLEASNESGSENRASAP